MVNKVTKIVTIGGGSGQSRLLAGLRTLGNVEITAICGMTDSGGSTARISRAYNLSNCIGDATKCMLGLCPYPLWREKLLWRFDYPNPQEYDLNFHNHSLKNLLFSGLEKQIGLLKALEWMSDFLQIAPHRVLPISEKNSTLTAKLSNGKYTVAGQTLIDTISRNPLWDPDLHSLDSLYLEPKISLYREAKTAIECADFIIFSPGDLFTSLIPNLLVAGVAKALRYAKGTLVYMPNLMTKPGETDKFGVHDMVEWAEKYIDRKIDLVICNNSKIPWHLARKYLKEKKSEPVINKKSIDREVLLVDLLDISENNIRHSSEKIAKVWADLLAEKP